MRKSILQVSLSILCALACFVGGTDLASASVVPLVAQAQLAVEAEEEIPNAPEVPAETEALVVELGDVDEEKVLEALARIEALEKLAKTLSKRTGSPGIEMDPAVNQLQIVNLPSRLLIDERTAANPPATKDSEKARKVSQEYGGPVVDAEVQAFASGVVWTFDDLAEPIVCPLDESIGVSRQAPTCGLRDWHQVTQDQPVTVTASIRYEVSWRTSLGNCAGQLCEDGDVDTGEDVYQSGPSSTAQLVVGEVAALGSATDVPQQAPQPDPIDITHVGELCPQNLWGDVKCLAISIYSAYTDLLEALSDAFFGVARLIWNFLQDCGQGIANTFTSFPEMIKTAAAWLTSPGQQFGQAIELLKQIYAGITEDPGAFITEVIVPVVGEIVSEPVQFVCEEAASYFISGGTGGIMKSLLRNVDKFYKFINDFFANRGPGKTDIGIKNGKDDDLLALPGCRSGNPKKCNDDDKDGCLNSFPTGTLVAMSNGTHKAIQLIEPGDRVLGHDLDASQWQSVEVIDQWSHVDVGHLATVSLSDGSRVTATDHHQFWVVSKVSWLELEDITTGDLLLAPAGVTSVAGVSVHPVADTLVWELDTDGSDNFVVHTGTKDLLVHNGDCRNPDARVEDLNDHLLEEGVLPPDAQTRLDAYQRYLERMEGKELDPLAAEAWLQRVLHLDDVRPPRKFVDRSQLSSETREKILTLADPIPSEVEFDEWWDKLSSEDLAEILKDEHTYNAIASRIRQPGGVHEWCMVCEQVKFKGWGVSMDEIREYRTEIADLEWTIPLDLENDGGAPGGHGGLGSTRFHNELREKINDADTLDEFVSSVTVLAERWGIAPENVPKWPVSGE